MLLRTVHCVDGGDGGMQAVRSAPGSRQVALALRRVMPPRIWRRAFHEAHRAAAGIDDAGVVAHAGTRAQALVLGVGDRRSVEEGKGGTVSVDPGDRRVTT